MGKLIGLILVAFGFGFAIEMLPAGFYDRGLALVSQSTPAAASPSDQRTSAGAPASVGSEASQARAPRVFAPAQPLVMSAPMTEAAPTGAQVVTHTVTGHNVTGSVSGTTPAPVRTTDSSDPTELARLLQSELRRVGCYVGEIDGSWGAGSKRAMQAFTERVNSTLPIEAPDLVLLSLVRGHGNAICSADCGAGQIMSSRGHCVRTPVGIQASATTPGGWKPVVTVESRAVASASTSPRDAAPRTTVRRVTIAEPAPQLVAAPVEAPRGASPAATIAHRDIDWSTRMSVGAAPPAAVVPMPPLAAGSATPQPVALTPAAPAASPTTTRRARPERSTRSAPRYVQRPAYIDRPRPASNWRREAFVSRN